MTEKRYVPLITADWYVPLITSRFSSVSTRCTIVDLGATNVAKTAPRTITVAATAKISFLIDVGAALV